jgi:CHAT domain-containing protein
MKQFSIQYLILVVFVGYQSHIQSQVNVDEQIAYYYSILDTSQNFELLHQTCYHIISTAQKLKNKDEEIKGVIETQLLFEAFINSDSLSVWIPIGEQILEKYHYEIRPTLYDSLIVRQHYHKARFHHLIGDYSQAITEYNWLWNNLKKEEIENNVIAFYTDMSLRCLAEIAYDNGKLSEATEHLWKSISLHEKINYENLPDQREMLFSRIAQILVEDNQIELANTVWDKAFLIQHNNQKLSEKYPYVKQWAKNTFYLKAISNLKTPDYSIDSASIWLEKANLFGQIEDNLYLSGDLNFQYGVYYSNKKEHKKSLQYFQNALEKFQKYNIEFTIDHQANTLLHIARELSFINPDTALFAIQKLFNFMDNNFTHINPKINPDPNNVDLKKYLSKAIALKNSIFLQKAKENKQDTTLIETALQCSKYQIDLLEIMREDYALEADKMTLITNVYHTLENVWETYCFHHEKTQNPEILKNLYKEQTKAKGRVMLERLSDATSLKSVGLNNDEINCLFLLKSKAANIEKSILQTKENEAKLATLHLDFALASQKYQDFRAKLETTYPLLQKQNTEANSVNVDHVQKYILDEKSAMIEYFMGDSAIFVFVFTKNIYNVIQISRPADIDKNILSLLKTITNAQTFGRSEYKNFSQWSDYFYHLLLSEVIKNLPISITKLIVIPDGQLSKLPFEILGPNNSTVTSFKKYPYLLRQYAVSYALSAQVLLLQLAAEKVENNQKKAFFAGFAPTYSESTHNLLNDVGVESYTLPGAENEVRDIASLLNGSAYIGIDATVEQFKKQAKGYRVLLLALHAIPDLQQPHFSKLLFTVQANNDTVEANLNTIDILQMDLSADLVVLSACQTGFGKMRKGEGVLSITRAFTAAGTKSVVMSLWKVPDTTTHPLMVSFFKALSKGMCKDEALRQAKLEFLDNDAFLSKQNPCFWAGFLVTGTTTSIVR